MKGFEESTSPFAPPYKGGEHQNAQLYVLPMLMLEEPNVLRMIE
jgi:hypothetical protein